MRVDNGTMPDFIETYDNALSADFCQQLIETFERSPHKVAGRTGGGVDRDKKVSEDLYLNQHPDYQQQLNVIAQATRQCLIEYLKKYRFALLAPVGFKVRHPQTGQPVNLTDDNFDELVAGKEAQFMDVLYRLGAIQAQKYPQGEGNYNYWHCEVFPEQKRTEALHRTLLFMVYLNDVEEGGRTDFYYQKRSLKPKQGQLVIAPAYFTHTHRGQTPISNDKYILTSWVLFNQGQQIYR